MSGSHRYDADGREQRRCGPFQVTVDGHLAELVYRLNGTRLVLIHTEVPEELGGRGIGGTLVEAALQAAVDGGLTLVPECPFSWLRKHPEPASRVTIEWPEE